MSFVYGTFCKNFAYFFSFAVFSIVLFMRTFFHVALIQTRSTQETNHIYLVDSKLWH